MSLCKDEFKPFEYVLLSESLIPKKLDCVDIN